MDPVMQKIKWITIGQEDYWRTIKVDSIIKIAINIKFK